MAQIASVSHTLNVWNFSEGFLTKKSNYNCRDNEFNCLAWNHTNQVVALGGTDSKIDLIEANSGKLLSSLSLYEKGVSAESVQAVAFSGNSRFLATSTNNIVQLWDLKKRVKKQELVDTDVVTCLSFLPTGDILSGNQTGNIRLYDPSKNEDSDHPQFSEFRYNGYLSSSLSTNTPTRALKYEVTSLNISPSNPSIFAAGYSDGYLCSLDTVTLQVTRRQRCHYGILTSLNYSPKNSKLIATAGADGRLLLVDTTARDKEFSAMIDVGLHAKSGGAVRLTSLSFHENSLNCAVSTDNGEILVYDWRQTKEPISSIVGHEGERINAISFQVPKVSLSVNNSIASIKPITTSSATSAPNITATTTSSTVIDKRLMSASTESLQSLKSIQSVQSVKSATSGIIGNSSLPPPRVSASVDLSNINFIPPPPPPTVVTSNNTNNNNNSHAKEISSLTVDTLRNTAVRYGLSATTTASQQQQQQPVDFPSDISPIVSRTNKASNNTTTTTANVTATVNGDLKGKNLFGRDGNDVIIENTTEVETKRRGSGIGSAVGGSTPTRYSSGNNLVGSNRYVSKPASLTELLKQGADMSATSSVNGSVAGGGGSVTSSLKSESHQKVPMRQPVDVTATKSPKRKTAEELYQMSVNSYVPSNALPTSRSPRYSEDMSTTQSVTKQPQQQAEQQPNGTPTRLTVGSSYISENERRIATQSINSTYLKNNNYIATAESKQNSSQNSPRPVLPREPLLTKKDFEESLDLLRYDIHREVQEVIKEQIRQFVIAQDETTRVIQEMSIQLADLLNANRELRQENEKLRRIQNVEW